MNIGMAFPEWNQLAISPYIWKHVLKQNVYVKLFFHLSNFSSAYYHHFNYRLPRKIGLTCIM